MFIISRPKKSVNEEIVSELLRLFRRTTRDMATGIRVRFRDSYDALEISILVESFLTIYMRRFWSHAIAGPTIDAFCQQALENHHRMAGQNESIDIVAGLISTRRAKYGPALLEDIASLLGEGIGSASGQLRSLADTAAPYVFANDRTGDVVADGSKALISWLHPLMRACTWILRGVPHPQK